MTTILGRLSVFSPHDKGTHVPRFLLQFYQMKTNLYQISKKS